ncbi:MAG: hypothetical protein ACI9GW_003361 [Halieaceae bacterium]|jgi:hypothetical protein
MKAAMTCDDVTGLSLSLTLYGTSGCHLCDEALALILPVLKEGVLALEEVDIAEQEELFLLYGLSIPVLRRDDNQSELNWPFDYNKLLNFLAK